MGTRFHSLARSRKDRTHRSRKILFNFAFALLLFTLFCLVHTWYRSKSQKPYHQENNIVQLVRPPHLNAEKIENSGRTLYFLPGIENRCSYRYDYICKFWFFIRCYVYAAFPNVYMLDRGTSAVSDFMTRAKDDDVAIVIWRSKNHSIIPDRLVELLHWRQHAANSNRYVPRVRIGVFHIANEINRVNWPWYSMADFVIRNYWIPNMPPHAMYVPLGPQLPNSCTPFSTERAWLTRRQEGKCSCGGLGYIRSSERRWLWSFSGSLRKQRARLLRTLRGSVRLRDQGLVQVAKKFGGDGAFGAVQGNPKNAYLEGILQSRFVFAPCGNAMETHRIYEAISLGAIPVVENCDAGVSQFFPVRELVIDGGVEAMVRFVEQFADEAEKVDALQRRMAVWWKRYTEEVGRNVSKTVDGHVAAVWRENP